MTLKKPLVIFPRQAALKEHRNDHQIATARQFSKRTGIYLASEEEDLLPLLDELTKNPPAKLNEAVSQFADPELIATVRNFIFADQAPNSVS